MRLYRCDFCLTEVEDYYEARWLSLQWFTGERSSDVFRSPGSQSWLFCSPTCVSHFAELESVQG